MSEQLPYHIPALLMPTVEGLVTNPDGVYIDATFGGGGHSRAILNKLSEKGRLFGFDQDLDALANVPDDPRFKFVHSNFRYISNFMRFYGYRQVDGILADIGVSFHHFDAGERGFSFREDSPLDMRMNQEATLTASNVINQYPEEDLLAILAGYGDFKIGTAKKIVAEILKVREINPIETTGDLVKVVEKYLNPRNLKKELAQVFQAVRIEVNSELKVLAELLDQSVRLLKPGGRIAVLSYHSLEDRFVKNFFRTGMNTDATIEDEYRDKITGRTLTPFILVTRSPIVASAEEQEANPRSRSAKLRIAERNETPWPPEK